MITVWVAVVVRDSFDAKAGETQSARESGDWSSFTDVSKDKAVRKALRFAQKWAGQHRVSATSSPLEKRDVEYRVLVGKLTSEAQIPVEYKEIL